MTASQTAINHKLDVLAALPNDRQVMLDWLHLRIHSMSDSALVDLVEHLAKPEDIEHLWHALACDEETTEEEQR